MPPVVSNSAESQFYFLPFVVGVNFGDRHIEFVFHLIDHTSHDFPFPLQGAVIMDQEINFQGTYDHKLQFRSYLFDLIGLKDIPRFDVLVIFQSDTALVARLDLLHIILEASQRGEFAVIYHDLIP